MTPHITCSLSSECPDDNLALLSDTNIVEMLLQLIHIHSKSKETSIVKYGLAALGTMAAFNGKYVIMLSPIIEVP